MSKTNQRKKEQSARLESLQKQLKKDSLDTFLVSKPENKTYLTGWEADAESGYLLITQEEAFLFTDSRYAEAAVEKAVGFETISIDQNLTSYITQFIKEKNFSRVGFESHHLSVSNFRSFKKSGAKLVPTAHLLETFRAVKEQNEIGLIRKAVEIDELAFKHILNFIKPGLTEAEVAWELEKKLKDLGSEKAAWLPFIVAAGRNSSIPHYGNSPKVKIKKGDILQLDYGSVVGGYHSDTSRVVFIGKPDSEQTKVYNWVRQAQELGESLVKPGRVSGAIDKAVRGFLQAKTDYYFRHGLGHGVGLEIHELPRISPIGKSKLEVGQCFTIEPGVYQPGWGGVRLEDVVVVTKNGGEVLTRITKEIKEITI